MKVRLLTDRAGTYGSQSAGEIIDLPDDEASRLIAVGQAKPPSEPVASEDGLGEGSAREYSKSTPMAAPAAPSATAQRQGQPPSPKPPAVNPVNSKGSPERPTMPRPNSNPSRPRGRN